MSLSELLRVFEISRKPCSRIETTRCHVIFTFAPKSRFFYTYFYSTWSFRIIRLKQVGASLPPVLSKGPRLTFI